MNRMIGGNGVSRFGVEFLVANAEDLALARRGKLPKEKVRQKLVDGTVDCAASKLVLPLSLAEELGLPIGDKVKVTYADSRTAKRDTAESAYVEILGRHAVFTAIIEPKRNKPLIGAFVLEELDFLVDCKHERLLPRDPRYVLAELE